MFVNVTICSCFTMQEGAELVMRQACSLASGERAAIYTADMRREVPIPSLCLSLPSTPLLVSSCQHACRAPLARRSWLAVEP